jgi:transcriptional regulator with XRE-family HTH domain
MPNQSLATILPSMNVHIAPTLAHRLMHQRRVCGLSQAELAIRSGVPLDELVNMEQGLTRTPYFTSVALLALVLGVDVRWLYDGSNGSPAPS